MDIQTFSGLVRAYRQQRGMSQMELAEKWGVSPSYVGMVEQGRRQVKSAEQLIKLADVLDIPAEKLEAIGRGIPERKAGRQRSEAGQDDAVLQMLLAPGRDMVRLAFLTWQADQHPTFEQSLRQLASSLEQALISYHGEFRQPAQQLLAYTHQMRGKIALDLLDLSAASGHFSSMMELGYELNDPDIVAIAMANQGNVLKKRGRFELAARCFQQARPFADAASSHVKGLHAMLWSRTCYDSGDLDGFERAIARARSIVEILSEDIASLADEITMDDILCEEASGYAELSQPKRALTIYEQADRLRPIRLLREKGSFTITYAQAYLQALELEPGVTLSLQGIELASQYKSRRHLSWLEKSYGRLPEHLKAERKVQPLREALAEARKQAETW